MTAPTRERGSPMLTVFLTVFVDLVGFGIVIPLLPLYGERHAPSPLVLGLFLASYSAMQFVFSPILGRLSDRFGRRPILLLSLAGSVVGYLLFAVADTMLLLFVSRLVAGIAGANLAAAQAVVADITPPEGRAKGMGMVGAAFGLGFVFGPVIGGALVPFGDSWPGLAASGFSLAAFLLAFFRLPETRHAASPSARRAAGPAGLLAGFRHPRLGTLFAVQLLAVLAFASFESTFSQFLAHRFGLVPRQVAWWFGFVGVSMVLVQGFLVGRLAKKASELVLAIAGSAVTAAGLLALAAVPRPVWLAPVLLALALGTGITNPSLSSLVSRLCDDDEQGAMLGVFQSMGSLGRIGGPIAGQFLLGNFSAATTYVTSGIVFAVSGLLLLAIRRRESLLGTKDPA